MKRLGLVLFALLSVTGAQAGPNLVTYHEIRALKEFASPVWSPRGARLALEGPGGIYLYDAAYPDSAPRIVAEGFWNRVAWSPDGQWLLIGAPPKPSSDSLRLQAVSLATGQVHVLYLGDNLLGPIWASDGYVYGWEPSKDHAPVRRKIEPPPGYLARYKPVSATYLIAGVGHAGSRPFAFRCDPSPKEWAILDEDSAAFHNVFPRDRDARGSRFLIALQNVPIRDRDQVIDAEGRVVARVGSPKAEWSTISGDGKWLAGQREIEQDEDIAGGILYVGDSKGTWLTSVDTPHAAAIGPRLAREGLFVCFEDPASGGLHVGKLNIGGH